MKAIGRRCLNCRYAAQIVDPNFQNQDHDKETSRSCMIHSNLVQELEGNFCADMKPHDRFGPNAVAEEIEARLVGLVVEATSSYHTTGEIKRIAVIEELEIFSGKSMAIDGPVSEADAKSIREFIGTSKVVAHGASFHVGFANAMFAGHNLPPIPEAQVVDTSVYCHNKVPAGRRSFAEICKFLEVETVYYGENDLEPEERYPEIVKRCISVLGVYEALKCRPALPPEQLLGKPKATASAPRPLPLAVASSPVATSIWRTVFDGARRELYTATRNFKGNERKFIVLATEFVRVESGRHQNGLSEAEIVKLGISLADWSWEHIVVPHRRARQKAVATKIIRKRAALVADEAKTQVHFRSI